MAEISEVDKLRQFKKGLVEVRRRTVQSALDLVASGNDRGIIASAPILATI